MRLALLIIPFIFSFTDCFSQNIFSEKNSNKLLLHQDDEDNEKSGFSVSMNLGMYFGNKKSAVLYNGNCYLEFEDQNFRCLTIEERIGPEFNSTINSPYNQILQYFNNQGDGVESFYVPDDSYPANMRYQPAFLIGMNVSYYFNNENAITLNINSTKLTAKDAFTLVFVGSSPQLNEPQDIRPFTVWGTEKRINVTLGLKKLWPINTSSSFFFEYGGSMLAVTLLENKIKVGGRDYSLIYGGLNFNQASLQFNPRSYYGFGFYISPGMQFTFNEKMSLDLGINLAREKVAILEHIDPTVQAKTSLWHSAVYVRFGI